MENENISFWFKKKRKKFEKKKEKNIDLLHFNSLDFYNMLCCAKWKEQMIFLTLVIV